MESPGGIGHWKSVMESKGGGTRDKSKQLPLSVAATTNKSLLQAVVKCRIVKN